MTGSLFDEVKAYVGWTDTDTRLLQEARGRVSTHFPAIVKRFYACLLAQPKATAVLTGGPEQLARLHTTLEAWLEDLFRGPHDDAYFLRRCEVGRTHVRVNLPQQFMLTGMAILRDSLTGILLRTEGIDVPRTLSAMNRMMDLDLAIMLDTYRSALNERIQEAERREMAIRLRETEQLASIGQLAASLAHEIKNPLAGISGAIQIIKQGVPATHPHHEVLDEILKQIHRLDAAVQDLLIYARPKPPRLERVQLGPAVLRMISLLREQPDLRKVNLQFEGAHGDPEVWVDESQLQQVVSNVLLNAAQACRQGDAVTIGVDSDGQWARVIVKDTGRGMAPDVADRAFEPFYTTKAKGTGLGLPICKKIVEAHTGRISLQSTPGEGTTVTLEFPLRPTQVG